MQCLWRLEGGVGSPGIYNYPVWVLGSELQASGKAAVLNHCTIFPVPTNIF